MCEVPFLGGIHFDQENLSSENYPFHVLFFIVRNFLSCMNLLVNKKKWTLAKIPFLCSLYHKVSAIPRGRTFISSQYALVWMSYIYVKGQEGPIINFNVMCFEKKSW